jgi:hypothetical protein
MGRQVIKVEVTVTAHFATRPQADAAFSDIEEAIGKHKGKMWESSLIEDDDGIPWIESGGGPAGVRAARERAVGHRGRG